jgi:glycosyltransferase involved in cell wall biosynthesis
MRIGLIGYTDINSGIGLFDWDLFHAFGDSILSINSRKGAQLTLTEKQVSCNRPPNNLSIERYLDQFRPEVVLFVETPFNELLFKLCKDRGIKVVGIPMHESGAAARNGADLYICPSVSAWEKNLHNNVTNSVLMFLPIGLDLFPYKQRTGHTFVMSLGYDGMRDRRQSAVTIKAFCSFDDPDMRLIVHTQTNIPGRVDDSRITYITGNYPEPKTCYEEGDIFLGCCAYGGYERTILEAMSSGMPTLTTNADPMNLFQHDPDLLIEPCRKYVFSEGYIQDTVYNVVSFEDMRDRLEWLMTIDTAKYSERARKQAEAQSWEGPIDYKGTWLQALAQCCTA